MMSKKIRYEKKFPVWSMEASDLEFLIKFNPFAFSETFYERKINSIYLDSIDLKNYHDNLGGVAERLKIRIRWYGELFGLVKNPRLEIKTKIGLFGEKTSFKLEPFILDRNFSFEYLQKKVLQKSGLPPRVVEMLKLSRLILITSYKRRYFISANKKYRLTLDRNLVFFKLRDRNNSFNEKIYDKDLKIIELKYPQEYEYEVSEVTQGFPFRIRPMSKYVYGVDLLDL